MGRGITASAPLLRAPAQNTDSVRTERHIAFAADGAPLVVTRFRSAFGTARRPALLLVHGLAQNRYSWQLSDRSLADWLANEGFDVFVPELRGHGLSRQSGAPPPRGFSDYVKLDAPAVLETAARVSGSERVFWIGHSLGGVIGFCLGGQPRLRGLVTLGSPAAFGADNPALRALGWFLLGAERMTPLRWLRFRRFSTRAFGHALYAMAPWLDRPNRFPLQMWAPGSFSRAALRERLTLGFDDTGRAVIRQMFVEWARRQSFADPHTGEDYGERLRALDVPVLLMHGNRDAVASPQTTELVFERATTRDLHRRVFGSTAFGYDYGHLDLVLGDRAPRDVWPALRDWLLARL